MSDKKKKRLWIASLVSALIGLGVIYYGFEQASIPGIHDAHEEYYVLAGLVLFAGGCLLGFLANKQKRAFSSSQEVSTDQQVG